MSRVVFTLAFLMFFAASMPMNLLANADFSDAPFLYYYSSQQEAFIIERADGTDSRILADYKLPQLEGSSQSGGRIEGPGWSPTGKWFAWTAMPHIRVSDLSAYVVSRDGNQTFLVKDPPPEAVALGSAPGRCDRTLDASQIVAFAEFHGTFPGLLATGHTGVSSLHPDQLCSHNSRVTTDGFPNTAVEVVGSA